MISCEARALAALIVLSLAGGSPAGCSRGTDGTTAVVEAATRTSLVSAADVGVWCADVDEVRACWDTSGRPALVPRALPPRGSPTPLGYRCSGQGAMRTCAPRDDVRPFARRGDVFEQTHPRQPDEGQWQCSDDSGVTVCTGGEPAAGVPPSPVAAGWECGERRRSLPGPAPERVCVDLSPDFPEGSPLGWRCRWRYEPAPLRECKPDPGAHVLGDVCDARSPCVLGAVCVQGRCLPPRPAADCSLDSDCGAGSCRFGSCTRPLP
ncbi:MAG: hypothetical protein ACRENE_10860 [Polyangiaceae bacterium]